MGRKQQSAEDLEKEIHQLENEMENFNDVLSDFVSELNIALAELRDENLISEFGFKRMKELIHAYWEEGDGLVER